MRKRTLLMWIIVGITLIFASTVLYAGTEVADEFKLENPAYEKHKKGIVTFSHKKHSEDYAKANPKIYDLGCGECHHDENNKPLTDLKAGDDVQSCLECHKKLGMTPGKTKKKWKAEKVSREEQKKMKLEWHAEAFHRNCIECHKAFKKKTKKKSAPITCKKCHPKKKK